MSSNTLGRAVAQLGLVHLSDSRAAVVARLLEMMREAKGRGAQLVVFLELALTTEAKKLVIGFYLGCAELTPEGRPYNTAILVDQNADIVGKYRKVHLPGHSDHKKDAPFQHLEKKFFDVGDKARGVWNAMGARIGMALCNDRRWPETWRVMSLQSAEVVVLGYNTPSQNINWDEPVHLRMHHHLITLQASA